MGLHNGSVRALPGKVYFDLAVKRLSRGWRVTRAVVTMAYLVNDDGRCRSLSDVGWLGGLSERLVCGGPRADYALNGEFSCRSPLTDLCPEWRRLFHWHSGCLEICA